MPSRDSFKEPAFMIAAIMYASKDFHTLTPDLPQSSLLEAT